MGSVMVDKRIGDIGDLDTVMAVLRTGPGALCHINGSRRYTYGHDQRIELFGENGMLVSENPTATYLVRHTSRATSARGRLHHSLERNAESYVREIDGFVDAVEAGVMPSPGFEDGRRALLAANAAAAPSVSLPETPRSKPFGSSENLQPESGLAAVGGCARHWACSRPASVGHPSSGSRGGSRCKSACSWHGEYCAAAFSRKLGPEVRSTPASSRASRQQTRSDC